MKINFLRAGLKGLPLHPLLTYFLTQFLIKTIGWYIISIASVNADVKGGDDEKNY